MLQSYEWRIMSASCGIQSGVPSFGPYERSHTRRNSLNAQLLLMPRQRARRQYSGWCSTHQKRPLADRTHFAEKHYSHFDEIAEAQICVCCSYQEDVAKNRDPWERSRFSTYFVKKSSVREIETLKFEDCYPRRARVLGNLHSTIASKWWTPEFSQSVSSSTKILAFLSTSVRWWRHQKGPHNGCQEREYQDA